MADGSVTYTPDADFAGSDALVVKGAEVLDTASVFMGLGPFEVNVTVGVVVTNVNDPPVLEFLPGMQHRGKTAGLGACR
jgi:hypothetical protein